MPEPKKETLDLTWVKQRNGSGFCFFAKPVDINAPPDTVLGVAKNVENYEVISKGAVKAEVNGPVQEGTEIRLNLYPGQCRGKLIPESKETISVVDSEAKVIGWKRKFFWTSVPTERYQILEEAPDHKTKSYIGLRVHGAVGLLTKLFFKKTIEDSFTDLNTGIKEESEKMYGDYYSNKTL